MGVVAPLSGLAGAGLPLVAGVLAGERAGPVTLCGVALALLAIALATAGTSGNRIAAGGLLLRIAMALLAAMLASIAFYGPQERFTPLQAISVALALTAGALLSGR